MAFKKLIPEVIREHKGKSFTGVTTAFICYDKSGRIFLAKRSNKTRDEHGNWDAGGGGLKWGESLEKNLIREIKEEYNFEPKKIDFIGYHDAFRAAPDNVPTHWLAMYFAVLVDPDQLKINEPEMVDDHGWFTIDTLPDPMHTMFEPFLKKHGSKLRKILSKK